jgi:hypothetical protein
VSKTSRSRSDISNGCVNAVLLRLAFSTSALPDGKLSHGTFGRGFFYCGITPKISSNWHDFRSFGPK